LFLCSNKHVEILKIKSLIRFSLFRIFYLSKRCRCYIAFPNHASAKDFTFFLEIIILKTSKINHWILNINIQNLILSLKHFEVIFKVFFSNYIYYFLHLIFTHFILNWINKWHNNKWLLLFVLWIQEKELKFSDIVIIKKDLDRILNRNWNEIINLLSE